MYQRLPHDHPLLKLFRGLIEQVFMTEVGICDTRLTEYLAAIMGDFVHMDSIYKLHAADGSSIREISRMEAEACLGPEFTGSERTRFVNRYIGDFTLFWAGMYPEVLTRRRQPLRQYLRAGKRSYGIASELSMPDSEPPAELLAQLSEEFETCVHGLHRVREGIQWPEAGAA